MGLREGSRGSGEGIQQEPSTARERHTAVLRLAWFQQPGRAVSRKPAMGG